MPQLTMAVRLSLDPWFNATRLLFPDENRVTRTVVSFARRLKIRRQGHKFRHRRRRSPGRSVRDDNFTTKCTTAPGGTPYTSFRKLPSSRSRSTVVFGARPSLPPRLPSPFPPPPASPLLLISFFFFFPIPSACTHVCVSLRRCLRGAMSPKSTAPWFLHSFPPCYHRRSLLQARRFSESINAYVWIDQSNRLLNISTVISHAIGLQFIIREICLSDSNFKCNLWLYEIKWANIFRLVHPI